MKTDRPTPALPAKYKVDGLTVYTRNGQTVVRRSKNDMGKPRWSLEQLCQRIRMANCVNLWQSFDKEHRPFFVDRAPGQTDYSRFIHYNVKRSNRYLTKEMFLQGGCLPFEMQMTNGTLPEIQLTPRDGLMVSSMHVGSLTIGNTTTLGEIASTLVRNNYGFHNNNVIGFFFARFSFRSHDVPRTESFSNQFHLDPNDPSTTIRFQYETLPLSQFLAVAEIDGVRFLAFRPLDGSARSEYDGIAAYHMQSDTLCSPSTMTFIHPSDAFTTAEAMQTATASYAKKIKKDYLNPNKDHSDLLSDFPDNTAN